MHVRALAGWLSLIVWSLGSTLASAQTTCDADEPVPPWTSLATGLGSPGSTQALTTASLRLCSATAGFGSSTDGYRVAHQIREHDFALEALVTRVDPGGSAGLVVVPSTLAGPDAARVVIEVRALPTGGAILGSSIRRGAGDAIVAPPAARTVSLPVHLRLVREANELRTEVVGEGVHLVALLDPDEPLMGTVRVGVAQASNDESTPRVAELSRITLSAQSPGAGLECLDASAAMSGAPLTIRGRHLDLVDGVRVGGVPARVVAASASRLLVTMPALASGAQDVELSQDGRYERVGRARVVGTPIRRGDVDESGTVSTADYRALCRHVYRRAPLACGAAGDVDADGDLDRADVDRLRRYLETGRGAPEAPFTEPGWVPGSRACGMPAAPRLDAITFEDGAPITRPVREGDVLVLRGARLPSAERAIVRFGATPTTVSSRSSADRLVVHVGQVVEAGTACPRIFDADPEVAGHARFGAAYGLPDGAEQCIELSASRIPGLLRGEVVDGRLQISVPRSALRQGERLRVSLSLHLPSVVAGTRGARDATFDFVVPDADYARSLHALAVRLGEVIHEGDTDECSCELAPTDVVSSELLILPPCASLPPLPPPEPTPTLPGLPTQLEATRLVWSVLDIAPAPPPGCGGALDLDLEPRRFFWCQLDELAEVQGPEAGALLEGLPYWATFRPHLGTVEPDPRARSMTELRILADPLAAAALDQLYAHGEEIAYRATQCGDDPIFSEWMPPLPEGARVLKTFWRTEGQLPASIDPATLYSTQPASGPRRYLVGLHVGYSIGDIDTSDEPTDYFEWATFWLDADGETHTRAGRPMAEEYSPHCTAGSGGDRPVSLTGTPFERFHMCTDSRAGEEACGNPWEPGECPGPGQATSCTGCHIAMGRMSLGSGDVGPLTMRLGWLPSVAFARHGAASTALSDLLADPSSIPDEWLGTPADNCPLGH